MNGLPFAIGEVLVRRFDGLEAWLAGAIVLSEEAPRAVLFVAPQPGGDRAVFAPCDGPRGVAWLSPVPPDRVVLGREPPSVLAIDGEHFTRTRRLPLHAKPMGDGLADLVIDETVILGEYASTGESRAITLTGANTQYAWRGEWLDESAYDRLPARSR